MPAKGTFSASKMSENSSRQTLGKSGKPSGAAFDQDDDILSYPSVDAYAAASSAPSVSLWSPARKFTAGSPSFAAVLAGPTPPPPSPEERFEKHVRRFYGKSVDEVLHEVLGVEKPAFPAEETPLTADDDTPAAIVNSTTVPTVLNVPTVVPVPFHPARKNTRTVVPVAPLVRIPPHHRFKKNPVIKRQRPVLSSDDEDEVLAVQIPAFLTGNDPATAVDTIPAAVDNTIKASTLLHVSTGTSVPGSKLESPVRQPAKKRSRKTSTLLSLFGDDSDEDLLALDLSKKVEKRPDNKSKSKCRALAPVPKIKATSAKIKALGKNINAASKTVKALVNNSTEDATAIGLEDSFTDFSLLQPQQTIDDRLDELESVNNDLQELHPVEVIEDGLDELLKLEEQNDERNEELQDEDTEELQNDKNANSLKDANSSKDADDQESEYISSQEFADYRRSNQQAHRAMPGVLMPSIQQEVARAATAPRGSFVWKFQQRAGRFLDIYWRKYEEAKQAFSAMSVSAKKRRELLFGPSRMRELQESRLTRDALFEMAMAGVPYVVQDFFGGNRPKDHDKAMAKAMQDFPRVDKAFYQGGYMCYGTFHDKNGKIHSTVYHGQTVSTVAARVLGHEESCHKDSSKGQGLHLFLKEAPGKLADYGFRVTHLHHDHVPAAVITFLEDFFMLSEGQVVHRKKNSESLEILIREMSSHHHPFPQHFRITNLSLPTKEGSHAFIRRSSLDKHSTKFQRIFRWNCACVVCGDDPVKIRECGEEDRGFWAGRGLILCYACRAYYRTHSYEHLTRTVQTWKPRLWPGFPKMPRCWTCDHPGTQDDKLIVLAGKVPDGVNLSEYWRTLWQCYSCRKHGAKDKLIGRYRTRPEYLWALHCRRKLLCQFCGRLEGSGSREINVRACSNIVEVICRGCAENNHEQMFTDVRFVVDERAAPMPPRALTRFEVRYDQELAKVAERRARASTRTSVFP